jgi:hypothetical protein
MALILASSVGFIFSKRKKSPPTRRPEGRYRPRGPARENLSRWSSRRQRAGTAVHGHNAGDDGRQAGRKLCQSWLGCNHHIHNQPGFCQASGSRCQGVCSLYQFAHYRQKRCQSGQFGAEGYEVKCHDGLSIFTSDADDDGRHLPIFQFLNISLDRCSVLPGRQCLGEVQTGLRMAGPPWLM